MSIDKSQFVTPTQLAKMLGITRIAIHQKIKKGEIKADNIGDSSKPTYLIPKASLSGAIQDRIPNKKFYDLKRELMKNTEYCHPRYLDPSNPNSTKKDFYNPTIISEFDKHYSTTK